MELSQVLQALRNADAAGDVEAARRLAQIADRLMRQPKTEPETKAESGFIPAARAGFASLKGEAALTAGKLGLMGLKEAEEYRAEREKEAKRIFKPTEEGWLQAPGTKVAELLGGSLPYMAAPIAAGAATLAFPVTGTAAAVAAGLAGGAASVAQFTGSNLARQIEEAEARGEDASLERAKLGNAVAAAVPQAALDVVSLRGIPLIRNLFKSVGKDITEAQAKAIVEQGFKQKLADYGRTTLMTSGREGFTEAGQQYLERLQAGLEVTDPAARAEYLESFIGGAVLGGVLAPGGRFFERGGEQARAQRLLQDTDAARRKAEREEAEKQAAAEEERRKQPEYLVDLQARYQAAKDKDAAFKKEIKQLEAQKDDPASLARAKELRRDLTDFQKSELSEVVKEYNKAGGAKFFKDFAEQQRVAGMTPLNYQMEQLGVTFPKEPSAEGRGVFTGEGFEPAAAPDPVAQYARQQLELARQQDMGTFTEADYAQYLLQDPGMAKRLAESGAQLPGFNKKQSAAILGGVKLQLQQEARESYAGATELLQAQATSPTAEFLTQWQDDQAALDAERRESVFDTRLTQLVNTALKDAPTVGVPEFEPEKGRAAGPQQLDLLAAGVEGERPAAEPSAGMRRPAEVLTRLDDLVAQRDAALRTAGQAFAMGDRDTGVARSADREAAQTALNNIEQQGGAPATVLKLRKAQESAMMNTAGLLDDLRTGTLLGEKSEGAASSTAETIRVQIDKQRAAFIDAAIKEAAVTRRLFGKALSQDEALKAALQMQQVFDEWVKRAAAAPTSAVEFIKSYERLPSIRDQEWLNGALEAYKKQVVSQALTKKISDISAKFGRPDQMTESQSLAAQQAIEKATLTAEERRKAEIQAADEFRRAYDKYQPRRPTYEKRYNKDGSSTFVLADKGKARLVDPRSLEERRFGDYKRATEVLQEQLSQISRGLSAVPEEGRRVESLLRPQYAQQEAARVAEARGETAQTLEGELRRRRDYVSDLIERAVETRPDLPAEIVQGLRRAQDAIDAGLGARDVVTKVEKEGKAGPAPFVAGLLDSAEQLAQRALSGRTTEVSGGVKGAREQKGYDAVVFKRDQIQREFDAQQRIVDGGVTPAGKRFSEAQKRKAQAHLSSLETQLTNINKQLSGAKRPTVEPVRVTQAAVTGEDAKLLQQINDALRLAQPEEGAPAGRMTDEQRAELAQQGFDFGEAVEPRVTKPMPAAELRELEAQGQRFDIEPGEPAKPPTKQADLFAEKELPATAFARATAKNFENSPPVKKARAAAERGKKLLADIKDAWGAKDKADEAKRKLKIAQTQEAIDKQREVYRETFEAALKKAQMVEIEARFQKEITEALQSLQAVSKERAAATAAGDKDAVRLIDVIRDAERDALLQLQADLAKALEKPSQNVEPAETTGLRPFQLPAELQAAADEWVQFERGRLTKLEDKLKRLQGAQKKDVAKQVVAQRNEIKQATNIVDRAMSGLGLPGVRVEGRRVTPIESAEEQAKQRARDEAERRQMAAEEAAEQKAKKQALEGELVQELLDLGTEYGVKQGQLARAKTDASKDKLKAEIAEIEKQATLLEAELGTPELTRTQKAKLKKARDSLFSGRGVTSERELLSSIAQKIEDKKPLTAYEKSLWEKRYEPKPGERVEQKEAAKKRVESLAAASEARKKERVGKRAVPGTIGEELGVEDVMSSVNIEGKDVFFSKTKGTPNNPSTTATLTAELEKALGFGLRTDKVKIYDNLADLIAENPQFKGKIPKDASAFVYAKRGDEPTAYLIASNIGKGDGLAILLHEVGAHIGFRNLFNESQYRGLANAVKSWATRPANTLEGKIGRAAVARAEAAQTTAEQMDDEIIAYAVEEAVKAGVKPDAVTKEGGVVRAWLKVIVDKLKQALQKFGVTFQDMKVGDLVNMAYGAAHVELRGTWHGTGALFQEFDHKYIGTGEGAQLYGWGTYRAQRYGTGRHYQKAEQAKLDVRFSELLFDNFRYKGQSIDELLDGAKKLKPDERVVASAFENGIFNFVATNDADFEEVVKSFLKAEKKTYEWQVANSNVAAVVKRAKENLTALKDMKVSDFSMVAYPKDTERAKASLMRVLGTRPESEYYMLDLPLKDQSPYVQDAVARALDDLPFTEPLRVRQLKSLFQQSRLRGDDFIFQLNDIFKDVGLTPKDASMWLFEHGIAGHKYLDRAARTGKVTDIDARFNYVDFGDKAEGPAIVAANINRIGVADDILFSRQPAYNPKVANAGRITDQLVSERPGFFAKMKENLLGLGFRTQFVDALAPLEKISGQMGDAAKAVQMMYYLRMYGQRMNFTSLAITDGVPQLVEKKRKDGSSEWVIESVPGVNIKDIVGTLSAKDVIKAAGSADAANRLFTLYMAKLRADNKGYDALNFGRAAAEAELKEIERELASGKLSPEDTARVKQRRAHLEKTKDSLPTEKDIKDAFAEIQADPVLREAFATARDQYNEYNRNLLQFMVQTGAMSKGEAERLLKEKDYIPYYRVRNGVAQLMIGGETPVRVGNLKDSPHLQELVGGEEPIFNFLDSSVQNTSMLVDMAMRNIAVKNAMWEMAMLGYAKVRKATKSGAPQGAVEFKKDGEDWYAVVDTEHIGIPSDLLVKGLAGIPTMFPAAVQIMGIPARFLRRAVTASPMYAFRQLMRDSTASFLASGANTTPLFSALRQIGKASSIDRRGVTGGQVFTGAPEDMARLLAEMQAGRSGWAKAFSKMEAMSMEADAATRRAQYESYIQQGLSEMEATMLTLESMNFTRRGISPSVQMVTSLIPFMNAQIQSLDVLYRSFRGQMPFNERLQIREKLIGRGLLLAGMTMAYALAMQDDEDYQNATPDQKYNNWFVPIPGVEEKLRVPIPFELGYIFKALPEAMINALYAERGADEAKDAAINILRNMIPGGSNFGVPQAVKPLIEVGLGKSFFTGRDIETGAEKLQEPWARYRDNTSEAAKFVGQLFNVSPIKIEALVSGYTGGMGMALLQATNLVLPAPETAKAEKRLSELPVIGTAFQPKDAAAIINDTFDRLREVTEAKKTYDALIERGELQRADAYLAANADRMALASVAGKYQQQIGKITQAERQIRGMDMSPQEKRELLDAMRQQKILVASSVRALLGETALR